MGACVTKQQKTEDRKTKNGKPTLKAPKNQVLNPENPDLKYNPDMHQTPEKNKNITQSPTTTNDSNSAPASKYQIPTHQKGHQQNQQIVSKQQYNNQIIDQSPSRLPYPTIISQIPSKFDGPPSPTFNNSPSKSHKYSQIDGSALVIPKTSDIKADWHLGVSNTPIDNQTKNEKRRIKIH